MIYALYAIAGFVLGFVACAILSGRGYAMQFRAEMTVLYVTLSKYTLAGSQWCVVPVDVLRQLFSGKVNAEKNT